MLYAVYRPKVVTHGFCKDRSVVSNAEPHVGQKYVLNIDIKDFFPSITLPRVRGLLKKYPYEIGAEAADTIARLCCFCERLPQGAPTSPILSNMLCGRLDTRLRKLAKSTRCTCTRYADDITFSTSLSSFPRGLAYYDEAGQLHIGQRLGKMISDEGFELNKDKLRLQHADQRQEVTGLVVNEKVNVKREYVREVRAMLHAWKEYKYEAAEAKFHQEYDSKRRAPGSKPPSYRQVVRGKIEYIGRVRGKRDKVYRKMMTKLADIDSETEYDERVPLERRVKIRVRTEGKTDWKHAKTAFEQLNTKKRYGELTLTFEDFEDERGDSILSELLKKSSGPTQECDCDIELYLFDADRDEIVKEMGGEDTCYCDQMKNRYSAVLPGLEYRSDNICIEHYYTDENMKQYGKKGDRKGRRLFTSGDFRKDSLRCKKDSSINLIDRGEAHKEDDNIIDSSVYNAENESIAMPKSDFAEMVVEHPERFDFSHFTVLFDMIHDLAYDWLEAQ